MTDKQRRINVNDLPKAADARLIDDYTAVVPDEAAKVKGGIRVGKHNGIRPAIPIKTVSGSSGDPGI